VYRVVPTVTVMGWAAETAVKAPFAATVSNPSTESTRSV